MGESLLAGLKVLDVASFIAAPVASTMLADLGADVIKVEPPTGDTYRGLMSFPGFPESDVDYAWMVDNRSKRGIAINLLKPDGLAILHELIAEADVFVINYPPRVRRNLKLRYGDVAPMNGRLIYASLSAYGEEGPEAERSGFDSTALWARTGLMDLVRPDPEGPPARSLPGMGDHPTGVALFGAIMTGLYRRQITGRGGKVHTSLMANGVWWNAFYAQAALCGLPVPVRPKREEWATGTANHYRCADGRWFILSLVNEEKLWPRLLQALGDPALANDPRFSDIGTRRAHARELIEVLDGIFAGADWPTWRERLDAADITYGVVGKVEDVARDQQMHAAKILVSHEDPSGLSTHTVASPVWVEGVEKAPPRPAPSLGEHTDEILMEMGRTEKQIAELRKAGVVV